MLAFLLLWLSPAFAFCHAPLLLLVAFLPFPTAVVGASITNPMAQTLFAGAMAAMVFREAEIKELAARAGLGGDPADLRRHADGSWAVGVLFALKEPRQRASPARTGDRRLVICGRAGLQRLTGGKRTMRSSVEVGVPRPSRLLVITQSQPSGPTATVRSRP